MSSHHNSLVEAARSLRRECRSLEFGPPVHRVYLPLDYAWEAHRDYLRRYGGGVKEVVLVGMNPGPWGMAQTGVPFGEVELVRNWLKIHGRVDRPADEHPKRPVLGWECKRREVSGLRLWGWAKERFGSPERFFSRFFVMNYCPICFLEQSGRNLTPDKLPVDWRKPLDEACDRHLLKMIESLRPKYLFGIGKFAADRVGQTCRDRFPEIIIGQVLHPSPASPIANRGWAEQAERQLRQAGVLLD